MNQIVEFMWILGNCFASLPMLILILYGFIAGLSEEQSFSDIDSELVKFVLYECIDRWCLHCCWLIWNQLSIACFFCLFVVAFRSLRFCISNSRNDYPYFVYVGLTIIHYSILTLEPRWNCLTILSLICIYIQVLIFVAPG